MQKIAIFASGSGSNAQKIMEHFSASANVKVALVLCNKPDAGVVTIAKQQNIPVLLIEKERFFRGDSYLDLFEEHHIDFIVLAGFLWKIPAALIQAFTNRIINIHPALLPKYGGKGMYGQQVHQAVIDNKETESGITIHYVDEQYDHGKTLLQARCPVLKDDTAASLALRIQLLEHEHYARLIEQLLAK